MRISTFLAMSVLGMALSATSLCAASAATELPFTEASFLQAQHDNKPILVHVWASWCPTCKAQAPTLSQIESDPANKDLIVYKVNFDTQKDVTRQFDVRMQSTLIAFHGGVEKARSTGDTDPASILALVTKTRQ